MIYHLSRTSGYVTSLFVYVKNREGGALSATVSAEVAVLGAGSAGCCAAIASARAGARTVLVDRLGFPGGTSTAVLDTFYAFFTAGESDAKVVAGLPDEPVARLRERGKAFERPNSFGAGTGYTYDPETLKLVWAELLREAGVEVLLHTLVCDADVDWDRRLRGVTLGSKAGLVELEAPVLVDATGDADLIARAGGSCLDDVDLTQPATLTFRVTGVDLERLRRDGRPRLPELIARGRDAGLRLPGDGGSLHGSGTDGIVHVALSRLPSPNYEDPREPGRLELEGLGQLGEWLRFLRELVPGCEGAEITAIGPMSGVRETRRIHGRYVLEEDDVLAGRLFDDQIALCGAPIEDLSTEQTHWRHVGGSGVYGIPWRCLLPVDLEGVLVAGRCLSATHRAHASARSMGTCMALGQAAGTAAAHAVARDSVPSELDADRLRASIAADGAIAEVDQVEAAKRATGGRRGRTGK